MVSASVETVCAIAAVWLVARIVRRVRGPRVTAEDLGLLDGLEPPSPEELERYVPQEFRDLGPDWSFTRGRVLAFDERRRRRWVGSVAGFDVEREFGEEFSVYYGVYGYYDHQRRLRTFRLPPTDNERNVRHGRPFIICFDRRSPRVHHLFPLVSLNR